MTRCEDDNITIRYKYKAGITTAIETTDRLEGICKLCRWFYRAATAIASFEGGFSIYHGECRLMPEPYLKAKDEWCGRFEKRED